MFVGRTRIESAYKTTRVLIAWRPCQWVEIDLNGTATEAMSIVEEERGGRGRVLACGLSPSRSAIASPNQGPCSGFRFGVLVTCD